MQRHASLTGHFYQTTAFLLSSAAEARLSIEERSALAEATRAGVAANRAAVEQEDAAALVRLRQAGMEVEERPDRAAFRATLAPLTTRWRSRFNSVLIGGLALVR